MISKMYEMVCGLVVRLFAFHPRRLNSNSEVELYNIGFQQPVKGN